MIQKAQFEHFSGLATDMRASYLRKFILQHFGGLAADMGKSCLRRLSLNILWAGHGYKQKLPQKLQFTYFGGLAMEY